MYNSVPTGSVAVRRSNPYFVLSASIIFLRLKICNIVMSSSSSYLSSISLAYEGEETFFFNCLVNTPQSLPFSIDFCGRGWAILLAEILHVFACLPFVWCGMINVFSYAIFFGFVFTFCVGRESKLLCYRKIPGYLWCLWHTVANVYLLIAYVELWSHLCGMECIKFECSTYHALPPPSATGTIWSGCQKSPSLGSFKIESFLAFVDITKPFRNNS